MKTGIMVADAMTVKPIAVPPSETVVECAKIMLNKRIGSLIVKEGPRFIGIITEQDIVRKAVAKGQDTNKLKASDVMSSDVILGAPEMDIFEALAIMRDYELRHLPVVDEGRLLGLITMKDVLKIEPDLFDILVEKMEIAEEGRKPISRISDREGICQTCAQFSQDLKRVDGVMMCEKCR